MLIKFPTAELKVMTIREVKKVVGLYEMIASDCDLLLLLRPTKAEAEKFKADRAQARKEIRRIKAMLDRR